VRPLVDEKEKGVNMRRKVTKRKQRWQQN